MQCPFLRKMNVKYCGMYRRTMIPLSGTNLATEICAGPDHRTCSLFLEHHGDAPAGESCPFLSVTDVHYCDVAPVRKLIPCNRTTVSRCTGDGHRFCRLYLAVADPQPDGSDDRDAVDSSPPGAGAKGIGNDGAIATPSVLAYAPNHMWLDRGGGHTCHVGVDAFFTNALGRIDAVSYPYHRDEYRPVVRFTVDGTAFDLEFPNPMRCTEINAHLVVDPSEVIRDPYGRGWLFEGIAPPAAASGAPDPLEAGLLRGEAAGLWMDHECDRLTMFVHEHLATRATNTGPVMQDGGRVRGHLAGVLDRGILHRLHAAFFSLPDRRNRP